MTIRDYGRVIRERWLLVLLAAVLGLLAAVASFSVREPAYTARSSLYVSATGALDAASAAYGAQLSLQRVKSYVALVSSLRVSAEVIAKLGLPEAPDQLAKKIDGSTPLDTVIIDVDVVDNSPERAAVIANAVGEVLTELPADLDRDSQIGQSTIDVRWVQRAAVPTLPSSTGLTLSLALGLLAGLTIGIGGALLRNSLDTSVRSPQQLLDATGTPNLGAISYDRQLRKRPLAALYDLPSSVSEQLHELRVNLRVGGADSAQKAIVVTSAVRSEGRTTLVANLAIALARAGARVLVIDADLRGAGMASVLGGDRSGGLTDVLSGEVGLEQAVRPWDQDIDVLLGGMAPISSAYILAAEQMREMIRELKTQYDIVLIDSPPLLRYPEAPQIAAAADGALLLCRYRRTTRDQVTTCADILRSVQTPVLGTVLTKGPKPGRAHAGLTRSRPIAGQELAPVAESNGRVGVVPAGPGPAPRI